MTKEPASSKPSAASGTNLLRKLQLDLPFRTEVIIITAIFVLCSANVALVAIALRDLHTGVTQTVIGAITESVAALQTNTFNATNTSSQMLTSINDLRTQNLILVFSGSMILTFLFGFLVVRVALIPTKAALETQRQFIGNITHELRTPLSIIKANSELLLMQSTDHETGQTIKSNIEEIDRISGIINNLLALSSFKRAGHVPFTIVDMGEAVRESVEKLETHAAQKHISLDADIAPELTVWGNKNSLAQVVTNLVKNAIMYTPEGGVVEVTCQPALYHRIAVTVTDTGIGIEQKKLKHIFEPFYQVEPSRTKQTGSCGLGLAIVNDLVKLHRGKISIKSSVGEGTTVRIEIPAHVSAPKSKNHPSSIGTATSEFVIDFSRKA